MSDIFSEVDDEVRRERIKQIWARYGTLILVVCALFIAGVAGWRYYQHRQAQAAAETGANFQSALTLSAEGKTKEAEESFAKIAAAGAQPYRVLGKFREASELARRDSKAAVASFDQIVADSSAGQPLQDLAAVRAASLLVDTASYDEMVKRLEPLSAAGRPFRHSARSLLAMSAYRANDVAAVRKWSDMVLADVESPSGARGQVQMLIALTEAEKKS